MKLHKILNQTTLTESPPIDDILPLFHDDVNIPSLTGRLVYHRYNAYGDGSSRIYILDFITGNLECISDSWTNVRDPMNAAWSADGTLIVFMGIDVKNGTWDIYLHKRGENGNPVNLTNNARTRDEDPKFKPGRNTKIVYKSTDKNGYHIKTLSIPDNAIKIIYFDKTMECSMPVYSHDGNTIYFAGFVRTNGEKDIFCVSAKGGSAEKVAGCAKPNVVEYYPIADKTGFFYSRNTPSSRADQIYYKNTVTGNKPEPALFNIAGKDSSDACIVDDNYIIISSKRRGNKGGYDLYLCSIKTGEAWPLNLWNDGVNTEREELGACYTPANKR